MIAAVVLMGCGGSPDEVATVRATLADAQVMVGEVRTDVLRLETALGELAIPLEHVGEVVPVEGAHLQASNQHVTVWLRNGSELKGRWADPELALGVEVGGKPVNVELPMPRLTRIQTPGAISWPSGSIFRVETTHGDDLLVDAEKTAVTLTNALGSFSPSLSECASLVPVGDPEGEWTVTLHTGTVLLGKLEHDTMKLALPMGPESFEVPVSQLKRLSWQRWGDQDMYGEPLSGEWFNSSSAAAAKATH